MRWGEVEVAYLNARCEAETAKALLCHLETGEDLWVPKSLVQSDSQVTKRGDEGELAVPLWFCEKEGVL
ncbi:MAG: hypothetical protein AMXMBFR56_61940 [Polyangiaceae bacterium]